MRIPWWGGIAAGALMICWGAYQHVDLPASPAVAPVASGQPEGHSLDVSSEPPVAGKDDDRSRQADAARQSPDVVAGKDNRPLPPADAAPQGPDIVADKNNGSSQQTAAASQSPEPVADKDNRRSQQAGAALQSPEPVADSTESRPQHVDAVPQTSEAVADKDQSRLQHDVAVAALDVPSEQSAKLQKEARLEEPAEASVVERSEPSGPKQDLSYLHYYAYSEYPPETKPANVVLNALKDVPQGTPVEEIKRVADLLGMDFTFLKAVAKIESGFDPKQRTGSYIGLFQLSKYEFRKHGSGDILDARDNAVAAALKMMNEAILFQMFTRKKATQFDLYLIHQQGIEGAAEHMSHPNRLAWRSMCKTQEGKQKGERWCKLAIWGNTLPTFKRMWKSVNKVTSGAFIAMWQERVSHFYGRYSQTAAAIK